jgi:hypothetical protein
MDAVLRPTLQGFVGGGLRCAGPTSDAHTQHDSAMWQPALCASAKLTTVAVRLSRCVYRAWGQGLFRYGLPW